VSVAQAARDLDLPVSTPIHASVPRYAYILRLVRTPYSPMIAFPDRQGCGLKAGMKLRSRAGSQRFSSLSS
jgi:hypothetical protein